MELYHLEDTICAVATPPGVGGLAIIRVCGEQSVSIVRKISNFLPEVLESHKVYYGFLKDKDITIDEVMVTYFKKGRSFTGNDVIEITSHGNMNICQQILESLIHHGARPALKGEFTYRAFSNGRIDLVQAESVLSLINSTSKKSSSLSLANIQGQLSKKLDHVIEEVTHVLANFEANIDFSVQDIEVLPVKEFTQQVNRVLKDIDQLITSYENGRKIEDGFNVVLVGKPNAGKSSLLNNLLGHNKAIVTNVPGTTRDVVEDSIFINGLKINFIDTAGIHNTDDPVEKLGILKTKEKMSLADLIVLVHDSTTEGFSIDDYETILDEISDAEILLVNNKIDLQDSKKINEQKFLDESTYDFKRVMDVSNISKIGLNGILQELETLSQTNFSETSGLVSNTRHLEHLLKCKESLEKSLTNIKSELSPEFIAHDLHSALQNLYSIIGKEYTDQVMDKVFQQFCIGK